MRFSWHSQSRVFLSDGAALGAADTATCPIPRSVLPDRPLGPALCGAMAAAMAGQNFRIAPTAGPLTQGLGENEFEVLTSGSSGAPRVIRRGQNSWLASFAVNQRLFNLGIGTKVGILGRLSTSLGLYALCEGLSLGADLYLYEGLRPDRQAALILDQGVQILYATPAQLVLIADCAPPLMANLAHLLVGGGRLDQNLAKTLAKLFPNAEILQFYGASETSFITLCDMDTPPNSVGRPYPGVKIVLTSLQGKPVLAGDLGQILVKSSYVALGYTDPTVQGAVWQDGYVSVGEWGRFEGPYLFLEGRATRMVTIADQNVFLEGVEAYLCSLKGVRQAFVLAEPDPKRGHRLRAIVQGNPACEAEVLAALRQEFGPLKAPKRLSFRTDWPLLPSGKVDASALEQTP
ncbi:MAG: AMP-binding protein [Paracoccaceae bacterium]|jgi:long-chain acyl-CoA synthetase|nr:AMP-binding protein [Pseudomonadota bacterium]MDA1041678.1 AMP-binding protein [Pseudomonadota bacterium]MDP5333197.1 AMP-binding protein [Paracoccaceae bacterium]MDP5351302.1 AMP-binding protein [Paracoccaceae bacterium]MDP5358478.1 AMP-binding protein [Paracoccaceae bacterium]